MKLTAMLIALMLSMNVSAFGTNQAQGQDQGQAQGQQMGQGQSLNNQNILAAAASNRTIVDLTSKNTNLNANISDNSNSLSNRVSNDTQVMNGSYSEGSNSKSNSNSGALSGSKSRAGDNTNNITIEGDYTKYPASSAMAGIASACVSTLAAQSQEYGISLGGESSDCKALRTALAFFQLASTFEASNPEMAEYYMSQGHYYAKKAGVTAATLFMSEARGFLIDFGISGLVIKAVLAAAGVFL